jgi:2-oxo-3-hexenedioate decarboxylase
VAAARLAEPLAAGDIVMASGATAAEWLAPGQHVRLVTQGLGHAALHVAKS